MTVSRQRGSRDAQLKVVVDDSLAERTDWWFGRHLDLALVALAGGQSGLVPTPNLMVARKRVRFHDANH